MALLASSSRRSTMPSRLTSPASTAACLSRDMVSTKAASSGGGLTGQAVIQPREALFLARPGEQAALHAMHAELARHCAAARVLPADEVLARVPVLRPQGLHAALLDPTGQDIDVHALHQGFLRGLRQRGGSLRTGAEVLRAQRDAQGWQVALPSELEWEKAARGTDGREFVWGNAWPPPRGAGNFWEKGIKGYNDGFIGPAPVGSFPGGASPYGCLDMAGDVWEWTSSLWKPYPYRADDGREDPRMDDERVFRGGCWGGDRPDDHHAYRRFCDTVHRERFLGFRLARSVE